MNHDYFFAKVKYVLNGRNREIMSNYFRKKGITIGKNACINCNIVTGEPYLIHIEDNVTIAGDVKLITHDASVGKIFGKEKISDICGEIHIGNNCFIGQGSTILYGVSLADNIIVAAGSVVTKSFNEENIIIGGNPAKKISTWDEFKTKIEKHGLSLHRLNYNDKKSVILKNKSKLVKR